MISYNLTYSQPETKGPRNYYMINGVRCSKARYNELKDNGLRNGSYSCAQTQFRNKRWFHYCVVKG